MKIKRELSKKLKDLAKYFPVLAILGPRQSGKTTLAINTFKNYKYISLEEPRNKEIATVDPKAFIETHKDTPGLILDEIQESPILLSYIQAHVDLNNKPGFFVITGSHNFLLNEKISQTLAGRVAICTLLPLSINEIMTVKKNISLDQIIFNGSYPRLYATGASPLDLYPPYIKTYVERDVRQITNITDLITFQRFIGLCAGRIGQILNLTSLANDCGVTIATAKSWISILAASYIIFLLQPHYKNFNKRLIKSPKIYFYDTGLACSILGIESQEQLFTHYIRGNLFESFIISELYKQRYNLGKEPRLYFWRDKTGHEIDCVIENGQELMTIEAKAGKTFSQNMIDGLLYWNTLAKTKLPYKNSFLIYGGHEDYKTNTANIISWKSLNKILN
jgi:predicted AAA+ superfamily ATPase